VFLATGPGGDPVVVRTFALPLTDLQSGRLVAALSELCGLPLEHPSIARSLSTGVEGGQPYLVHAFLPGVPLAELPLAELRRDSRSLPDVAAWLPSLAGALDLAASTGVLHGALSPEDVTFAANSAGVSGLGLVQALESAGVQGFHARREDDIRALIGIAREVLQDRVSPAVEAVLSGPPPPTALALAAAVREALSQDRPATLVSREQPAARIVPPPLSVDPLQESLGRLEFDPEAPVPAIEDLFHREATTAPAAALDFELRREPAAPFVEDVPPDIPEAVEPAIDPRPMFGTDAPRTMFSAMEPEPVATRSRGRSARWLIVAVVALGLGVSAGKFFVGRDLVGWPGVAVAPSSPAPSSPAPTPEKTTPAPAPATPPAGTGGQNFTDAAVDEPPPPASAPGPASVPAPSSSPAAAAPAAGAAVSPPAAAAAGQATAVPDTPAPPVKPRTPPRSSRAQAAPERSSGPAGMLVDSRPAGAQVFVDGRSVGYTPIVVSDLSPGTHSVRMQIPGYRPWVTAVTLRPGARERVAASLEQ